MNKILAIKNESNPAFYCKKCKLAHHLLYVDSKNKYCEGCVSVEIKNKALLVNQNREVI